MDVSPSIIVGPTKFPYGYDSGALKFRPSRMILPPSASADVMRSVTLPLAPGDIKGPLYDGDKLFSSSDIN